MLKTKLNHLELEEKKLADQLREVCGEDGRETNLSTSSSIFLEMANIYHEKFLLLQNDDPTKARFDMIKLIALTEAAKQRCNDTAFLQRVKSVKQEAVSSFLKFLKANCEHSILFEISIRDLLKSLNIFRIVTNKNLKKINNPYKNGNYTEAEEKLFRSNIEQQCKEVTQGYAKLMVEVYSASIAIIGHNAPCKFALMGLGSLARQEVTSYSDFESFILVERKNRGIMEYFKDLSALAHVLVVSLGETIIPAVGISSIKALGTEDGWYFDAFTKHGVSFDGLLPKASKNPLGPQPCDKEFDTDGELINTPIGMVEYMSGGEEANKEKMALARMLVQAVLVQGDENLSKSFLTLAWRKIREMCHDEIFTHETYLLLRQDVLQYDFTALKQSKKIDIKKDLYQGISVLMPTIGILCNEHSKSSFDVIRNLKKNKIITKAYKSDLNSALAIVNYIRLIVLAKSTISVTEINQPIKSENINVWLMNEISSDALVKVFKNGHVFQQYILTAVSYKDICRGFAKALPIRETFHKGNVYARLGKYTEAIESFLEEKRRMDEQPAFQKFQLDLNLGLCYYQIKEIEKAYRYFKQALSICDPLMSDSTTYKANALQCMALCEIYTKNYSKAWGHFQTSIDLLKDGEKSSTTGLAMKYLADDLYQVYQSIVDSEHLVKPQVDLLIAAGNMLQDDKQYEQAIGCYNTAVKKQLDYYGTSQENTTEILHKTAQCFQQLGEYDMAVRNCSKSFHNIKNATQFRTQAPDICDTFMSCSRKCTDVKRCFESLTEIISASQKWPGTSPSRIAAKFHYACAVICERQGNYKEAIQSYEKARNTYYNFYFEKFKFSHPIVAQVQLSISKCHQKLGNYKAEMENYSQILNEGFLNGDDYNVVNKTQPFDLTIILNRALANKSIHVGLMALTRATTHSASRYMKTQQWLPGLDDKQLLNYMDRICDESVVSENEKLTAKDIGPMSYILECILYILRFSSFSSSVLQKFILENINSTKLTSTEKRVLFMSLGNYHKGRSELEKAIEFYQLGLQTDEANINSYTCRVAASLFDLWGKCLMLMNDTQGAIQQFSDALHILYSNYENYALEHNTLIKIEILLGQSRCWLINKKYRQCSIVVQKTWNLIKSLFHDAAHGATQTLFPDFFVCLLSCAVHDEECAEFLGKNGFLDGQSINLKASNTLANSLTRSLETNKIAQLVSLLIIPISESPELNINSGFASLLASSILRSGLSTLHRKDTDRILTELFEFVLNYPHCKSATLILHNLFQITSAPITDRVLSKILTHSKDMLCKFTNAVQGYFCKEEPKVYLSCARDIIQQLMRCEYFRDAAGLCEKLIRLIWETKPKRKEEYQFKGILCLALLDKAECLKHISDIKSTREDLLRCIEHGKDLVVPEHVREIIYIEREVQSDTDEKLGEIWTAMTSKLRKYISDSFDYKLWANAPELPAIKMSETSKMPRLIPGDTIYSDIVTTTSTLNINDAVESNDCIDSQYDMVELPKD